MVHVKFNEIRFTEVIKKIMLSMLCDRVRTLRPFSLICWVLRATQSKSLDIIISYKVYSKSILQY